jgi:hypothetical protein
MSKQENGRLRFVALPVRQWLPSWDMVRFDRVLHRERPAKEFYITSMPATFLRQLSGVYRRKVERGKLRSEDLGLQRRHDPERSAEIGKFIENGFPWSDLSDAKRDSQKFDDLRKPGWLPSAIVVNILRPGDERDGQKVDPEDLISVSAVNGTAEIVLPRAFHGATWTPRGIPPIEVIDGQHRLWAVDTIHLGDAFELPVVAFVGLDVSWKAYLFWTINIKPKRINPSLAFDMYPLLRTEDWLERFEGHSVYRETRAQELTEALWAVPQSPFYQYVNMLGDRGTPGITQAAWIRSLMASFVKAADGPRSSVGGLYGSSRVTKRGLLPWTRAQQGAFLIKGWSELASTVAGTKYPWAQILRADAHGAPKDAAFYGEHSLLNSDPGIRGVLYVLNDLCFVRADAMKLSEWLAPAVERGSIAEATADALKDLEKQNHIVEFFREIAGALAAYDWRSSSAPDLKPAEARAKQALRGSGGYRLMRLDLLRHLSKYGGTVGDAAHRAELLLLAG